MHSAWGALASQYSDDIGWKKTNYDQRYLEQLNCKEKIVRTAKPPEYSCAKIVKFPKFYVRHIGSAMSKNGNPMSNSYSATPKALEYKIPRKSLGFQNIMFTILGRPFWILKIRCRIHNQRPQFFWLQNFWAPKLLSTEFCGNRVVSKIACPTYWISAIFPRVWLLEIGETSFFLQFNYSDHRWS